MRVHLQKIPEEALGSLLGRAPVARAAGLGLDLARELLHTPDGAIVKEGGASGKQIRRSFPVQQLPSEDKQGSIVRPHQQAVLHPLHGGQTA